MKLGRGKWWQYEKPRPRSIYGTFTRFVADKDGGPILRGKGTWRDTNGFMVQHAKLGRLYVIFRRHGKFGI